MFIKCNLKKIFISLPQMHTAVQPLICLLLILQQQQMLLLPISKITLSGELEKQIVGLRHVTYRFNNTYNALLVLQDSRDNKETAESLTWI